MARWTSSSGTATMSGLREPQSTAIPPTCGGRSTTPAIGFLPCSPWQSVGPAAAILPRVVSSRQPCSSTGYASGSSPLRLDDLNQIELPALDKPEAQAIRNREGRGASVELAGRQRRP